MFTVIYGLIRLILANSVLPTSSKHFVSHYTDSKHSSTILVWTRANNLINNVYVSKLRACMCVVDHVCECVCGWQTDV